MQDLKDKKVTELRKIKREYIKTYIGDFNKPHNYIEYLTELNRLIKEKKYVRTRKSRILDVLKGLDYADQAKILDSCKKSLKTIAERKESLKEWGTIHKSLILES